MYGKKEHKFETFISLSLFILHAELILAAERGIVGEIAAKPNLAKLGGSTTITGTQTKL